MRPLLEAMRKPTADEKTTVKALIEKYYGGMSLHVGEIDECMQFVCRSLSAATGEDVGREELGEHILPFVHRWDQDENYTIYDLADALKTEFNITRKPPAAQKE